MDYECTTVVSATDLSPGLIALLRSLGVDPDSLGTGDTVGVGCQPTAGSPAAPINITDGTRTFDCSNITVDLLTVTVLRGCDAV
ncbi:hypothetical protein DW322_08005 [Rhodococcus rhodnii]|uniref:Uncharacterized protein n=2 Tax=Rhodococcus rhodnii TaxID=38312 RepID=R7WP37_9NOCA|nr:hypothetical protein Rrhod_2910 [Rhodococcus rhodnii LMG 5362]TXG90173.1 hypothetical protein DW322_08005 [Rhodococcus rhodnii]